MSKHFSGITPLMTTAMSNSIQQTSLLAPAQQPILFTTSGQPFIVDSPVLAERRQTGTYKLNVALSEWVFHPSQHLKSYS